MKQALTLLAYIMLGCGASFAQESITETEDVTPPEINPCYGESFFRKQQVTFSCTTDGAKIYYTTDGTVPTASSTEYSEDTPLYIDNTTTIKAIAVKDEQESEVSEKTCKKDIRAISIQGEYGGNKYALVKSTGSGNKNMKAELYKPPYIYTPQKFKIRYGWLLQPDGTITHPEYEKYLSCDGGSITQSNKIRTQWEINDQGEIYSPTDDKYILCVNEKDFLMGNSTSTKAHVIDIDKGMVRENVGIGNYQTFCVPYDVVVGDYPDATYYSILGKTKDELGKITLYLTEETGILKAGVPYIFKANKNDVSVYYLDEVKAIDKYPTYQTVNGLKGVSQETTLAKGMYIIYENRLRRCGENCKVDATRAYINMDKVPDISESAAIARKAVKLSTGGTTAIDDISEDTQSDKYYNLQGQRVITPRKGLYIVNGKKVIIK